jgi:hypothetical protein
MVAFFGNGVAAAHPGEDELSEREQILLFLPFDVCATREWMESRPIGCQSDHPELL